MLFFLLCFYIVCYYIRPFEWIPGLIGSPIFSVMGGISIIALLLAWSNGKIRLFQYKTDQLVLGFTLAIVLSHLSHGYIDGAVISLQSFFPIIVGYFLVAHGLDSKKKINWFILLLIGLTTILAYEGVLQVTDGMSHGGMEPFYQRVINADGVLIELPRIRWFGPFNDPNDLGLALVLVVPFLVDFLLKKRWILTALTLPLLVYAVYLTNSRGAILSLAAGLFAYLVLRYRSMKGVIVGLVLAAMGMTFGPSRMAQMSAAEESANGRLEAWHEGFQMFKSSPLFGVGQGMFTDYHNLTAHNSYVLVLAELGFFGSLFFMGLFLISFRWGWVNLLSGKPEVRLAEADRTQFCALFGSLTGLMTAMFFLSRSYILLPFIVLALLTAYVNLPEYQPESTARFDLVPNFRWGQIALVVVGEMIFINVLVKMFL